MSCFKNHGPDARLHRYQLNHCLDDLVARTHALAPFGMLHAGLGEEGARSTLRPQPTELRIGAVHRDPEPKGEIAVESGGVVRNEAGAIGIARKRADLLNEPWTLEELRRKWRRAAVVRAHEVQPLTRMVYDDAGRSPR